jgi:ankyrin repeat protein
VVRGYVPIAKALIDGGAEVNGRGYPLNAAARTGQAEMVALLIQRGADVNARDLIGNPPLVEAVLSSNGVEVAKMLLAAGADPYAQEKTCGTALHLAAQQGNVAMAELLLAVGMDINVRAGPNACYPGSTPLHEAARHTQFAMVDYLIQHGAALDARDDHGATPLMVAFDPRVKAVLTKAAAE